MEPASDPSLLEEQERSSRGTSDDDLLRAVGRDGAIDPRFHSARHVAEALHRHLVRARVLSARMAFLQRTSALSFHTSSLGEEGAIVGAALAAGERDWVFPGAREWYAALVRGMPLATYIHHAFGSSADPAKGHQSPDHAPARSWNVVPPSGVLGAHLVQAVGAAWAAKIKKDATSTVALFGAEVAESGDFHNAMNFAGVFKTPTVFVCRSKASPPAGARARIVDRAVAYGLASARVDGADALAMYGVVRAALARAVEGKGATLIEAVVPALGTVAELDDAALESGHVLDLGDEDPLTVLRRVQPRDESVAVELRRELDAAIEAARAAGAPPLATIFEDVYASPPAHLAAQHREAQASQANRPARGG